MKNVFQKGVRLLLIIALLFSFHTQSSVAQNHSFDLYAFGECNCIALSWNPIAQADSYWIYRGTSKDSIHSMPLTDFPVQKCSYVDSRVENDQEYWYYISAVGKDNETFASSERVAATPRCGEEPTLPPCKLVLQYQVGNTVYWINNDSQGPMDTAPILMHARMFLVIRYVTNAIPGVSIDWDSQERKVTIFTHHGDKVELWIGQSNAKVNGKTIPIDPNDSHVVPIIQQGRTLLPLRFVAENMGATGMEDIQWDPETNTVTILVEDPECSKEGFRYPVAIEKKGGFYEFSVEYHASINKPLPVVKLILGKQDNTKTLRFGHAKEIHKDTELTFLSTPKATVETIPTNLHTAQKYIFRLAISPGILHLYRFSVEEKEYCPSNHFAGPIYAHLPGTIPIKELHLENIKDGSTLNLEGYFTAEPYPMLVDDYWSITERQETNRKKVLLQLQETSKIDEGTFVAIKGRKKTLPSGLSMIESKKILFSKPIHQEPLQVSEIVMAPPSPLGIQTHRFSVLYTGCIDDAEIEDEEGNTHVYHRSRADFTGDVLNTYKTCFSLGIPKNNIYVCFGRGDDEIDEICADDGDGNPFDFEWDDREYRNTMEQDAQRWWRMDDGWRIRQGTKENLLACFDEISHKIDLLPNDVIPEVYIFIATHGNVFGICTYGEGGIMYQDLIDEIEKWKHSDVPQLHSRTKIRILNNTCKAGAIIQPVENAFKTSGYDYVQVASSSGPTENSYGQYPGRNDSSYASAGGTFGIPFRISLDYQAKENPNREVDWNIAYDYTMLMDKYVRGVDREYDDGTIETIYVHPQFWSSRNRSLFQSGPAFEEPLTPEEEIAVNRCRIGVDTSESTFDVCNCSQSGEDYEYPKSILTIVNRGIFSFQIVDIQADESVLSKSSTYPAFIFRENDYGSCREQSRFVVRLNYNESHTFHICLQNHRLNAQPLDENGYMEMENNLPKFISVPIIVTYRSEGTDYTQEAQIPIRVRPESYQMRYSCSTKRAGTIKSKFTKWNAYDADVKISPLIEGLGENVIAGPQNEGDFHIKLQTDIYENLDQYNVRMDQMKAFRLDLHFDYMGETANCIKDSSYFGWGWVRNATIPTKLKDQLTVLYPETPSGKEAGITILVEPNALSEEGYQSILGTHTFQFEITRIGRFTCEGTYPPYSNTINLTVEIEFTTPSSSL
jgi:hypothetical protein